MRIFDNIEMIKLEGGMMCPVLVWGGESLALIDAGVPGQAGAIAGAIKNAGFDAGALTHIFLTHQDLDHVGSVNELLKLAPAAKVLAHKDEAPYIDGRLEPIKGFPSPRIAVTQELASGETLPICGGIEVVHTPGHTPGHICLYLRSGKVMVCGDAVNIANGQLAGPNPVYTQDMALGAESLEKIKNYGMDAVVTYHCGYLKLA